MKRRLHGRGARRGQRHIGGRQHRVRVAFDNGGSAKLAGAHPFEQAIAEARRARDDELRCRDGGTDLPGRRDEIRKDA